MSDGNDIFKEVRRQLDRVLAAETRPDYKQLIKCVEPAFERYNDLLSDNKRISAMQHFVLSDLNDMKAKEHELEKERMKRRMIPKSDVAIQEPERIPGSSDDSSSEEEKPLARPLLRLPLKRDPDFQELDFVTGITDAALLNFDPRSRPIPTPWRRRRKKSTKAFFAKFAKSCDDGGKMIKHHPLDNSSTTISSDV